MKLACGISAAVVLAAVLGLGGVAKGDALNISGVSDVTSNALTVTYTYLGSNVGEFVVTGTVTSPNTWSMAGGATYTTGSFTLDAFVNVNPTNPSIATFDAAKNGMGMSGNYLSVTGNGNPLFTSTELTNFGFSTSGSNGSPNWQFEFAGTGPSGPLASIGINLHGNAGTKYSTGYTPGTSYTVVPVDFDDNFSSTAGWAGADTFVLVPLPSAAWMGLSVPVMALLLRRKHPNLSL